MTFHAVAVHFHVAEDTALRTFAVVHRPAVLKLMSTMAKGALKVVIELGFPKRASLDNLHVTLVKLERAAGLYVAGQLGTHNSHMEYFLSACAELVLLVLFRLLCVVHLAILLELLLFPLQEVYAGAALAIPAQRPGQEACFTKQEAVSFYSLQR